MTWRNRFQNCKAKLLSDPSVCPANRALFADFFEFQEHKLKRMNSLSELDEGCAKTLCGYVFRFKNVNQWFGKRPWVELTRDDIKRVYDALEDGTIRTQAGAPFRDLPSYYNKIFKSKPFRLAGKDQLAREVIEFSSHRRQPVRYTTEESFRKITSVVCNPVQLLLLWLAWDIGENVGTLLSLTKRDFISQANRQSGEREYLVHLPEAKLKRSRMTRNEVTLYPETVRYVDMILERLGPDDLAFPFEYAQARKFFRAAVRRCGATTMPLSQPVRWKDLRSGMACHLLKNGWTRDEVNARLGHTPSSSTLNAYINFLALDRDGPKQRLRAAVPMIQPALGQGPMPHRQTENSTLREELVRAHQDIDKLRRLLQEVLAVARPATPTSALISP